MKNFRWNKVTVLVLLLVLLSVLAGCRTGQDAENAGSGTNAAVSGTEETAAPAAADGFVLEGTTYQIVNGFIVSGDGQEFYRIDGEELVSLTGQASAVYFTYHGIKYSQYYIWAQYDGEICLWLPADASIELTPVRGSSLVKVSLGDESGTYFLLMDVEKGKVADPLASLPEEMKSRINDVEFSPNGTKALLQCDKGESLYYFSGGELQDLSGQYTAGYFLDNDTAVLTRTNTEDFQKPTISTAAYAPDADVLTGVFENMPLYQQDTQETGVRLYGGRYAVRRNGDSVTILDLLTGAESRTSLQADGDVFYFDETHFLVWQKNGGSQRFSLLDAGM